MHKNLMKSCFVLAVLIISLASLSSAACPWFIRNELYSAQCGVVKEVPANAGILANDPGAVAVLNPGGIMIDPKYGTIEVEANGSFVYDPSPNIQSGTYVTFAYSATNGACKAKYNGSCKIQVSCKCRANVVDVTICTPRDLDDVKANLMAAGVGCWGCGTISPVFDLSQVELQPGTYPYLLKCPYCTAAACLVTVIGTCQVYAPDFTFCEDEITLDELLAMIEAEADCAGDGCDHSPAINIDNVTVADGYVAGGNYTATCREGTDCESSDSGTITVVQKCEVEALSLSTACTTLDELVELLKDTQPCGDSLDAALEIDTTGVTVDKDGFVSGGNYIATCTVGPGCESSATGEIISTGACKFCSCEAAAAPIEVCKGRVTKASLEAMIFDGNSTCEAIPGLECNSIPEVNLTDVQLDENGYVTGGAYTIACGSDPSCPPAWSTVTAIDCAACGCYKSDLGSYRVLMDQTTDVGVAHVEIAGGNLVVTVAVPGMTSSYFKAQTTPITDCSTGSDWEQLGGGNTIVYTKPLSEISGLSCSSNLYIGVHVNAPNTAWAKGGCDINCESGGRWAYGICISGPICKEKCTCDP